MRKFIEIDPTEIRDNPFQLIGQDWMLITAGKASACNTMTASWGGLGVLWNAPVSFCFVRPSPFSVGICTGRCSCAAECPAAMAIRSPRPG